jgi:hypothetical protein
VTDATPTPPDTTNAAESPARPVAPGERRLAHPPSDRYRAAEAAATEAPDPAASRPRGVAVATVIGVVGAAAIVVVGGVLAITFGLLLVTGMTGLAVASGLRVGAREHVSARDRVTLAVALTLGAIALGQLGLWLYARNEGGVLAPLDYLWEVFGILVPLQFAVGAVVAWVAAR